MTDANHTVTETILGRRSPYVFSDTAISKDELKALFEAARWAPSSYNEQPWRFIVGQKGDAVYDKILSTLVDANAAWASQAPVLVIAATSTRFARNDKENGHARYDLGQSVASLALAAWSNGIAVHQMAGFSPDVAAKAFALPDGTEAVTAIAIGKVAAPETLDEDTRQKEQGPRQRRPLSEIVFGKNLDTPIFA